MQRYGMTIPLGGPLHSQREQFEELVDLGYTDVWSAEADGHDGFTPLAARLGVDAVAAARHRHHPRLHPRVRRASPSRSARWPRPRPGRFALGIGSSSNVIVERWNGIPFDEPYKKVRDMVRFLRRRPRRREDQGGLRHLLHQRLPAQALPPEPVPILVAALREGMLKLAGREGDGAIINWLSADDVTTVAPIVQGAATDGRPKEVVARIFVRADRRPRHRLRRRPSSPSPPT